MIIIEGDLAKSERKDDWPVMLDLETLGTGANSAIISIGACEFNPDNGEIGSTFKAMVCRSSCFAVGCTFDQSTLEWWNSQSEEAKATSFNYKSPSEVGLVLTAFSDWLRRDAQLWGNGSDFDNAMLAELYRKVGMPQPWKFWNNRCYRTMKNMFPNVSMPRHGVHHDALDDAISQAKHLCKIIGRMRNMHAALG